MSPAKRFLLILGAVSLVVWIGANLLLGPPGLSRQYLGQYKKEHERYIEVTKSLPYKLYTERPHLHGPGSPGAPENLAQNIVFVEQYEANPAFQAEQRRIGVYGLFFDFFNAGLVIVILVRFVRKPVLNFLDEKVAEVRDRIESAAQAREAAEERRRRADHQLAHLDDDRERIAEETARRLEHEMAALKRANERSLALLWRELADRKHQEIVAAKQQVKRELVNETIQRLVERYRAEQSPEREADLIDQFVRDLEARV